MKVHAHDPDFQRRRLVTDAVQYIEEAVEGTVTLPDGTDLDYCEVCAHGGGDQCPDYDAEAHGKRIEEEFLSLPPADRLQLALYGKTS